MIPSSFPDAHQSLKAIGLNLHYLAKWRDGLVVCKQQNYFGTYISAPVESFLAWSGADGGATETAALSKKEQFNEYD